MKLKFLVTTECSVSGISAIFRCGKKSRGLKIEKRSFTILVLNLFPLIYPVSRIIIDLKKEFCILYFEDVQNFAFSSG